MSFSSFLPFPFVHSFDNTVVFCADFGQCVLLCIFNAKAMENGLILSKHHSGAGLLLSPFLLESGLFFLNMPSQKNSFEKKGPVPEFTMGCDKPWISNSFTFHCKHFPLLFTRASQHRCLLQPHCGSLSALQGWFPPMLIWGCSSDGRGFAAIELSSASSHLALKIPCPVMPLRTRRWLKGCYRAVVAVHRGWSLLPCNVFLGLSASRGCSEVI